MGITREVKDETYDEIAANYLCHLWTSTRIVQGRRKFLFIHMQEMWADLMVHKVGRHYFRIWKMGQGTNKGRDTDAL